MKKTMSPSELEKYLHDHIPLSKAMEVSVLKIDDNEVVLRAPLTPNINHRATVFGGSSSALAILSAWALLHTRMRNLGIESRLVIQRNTMEYEKPIEGEFIAQSSLQQKEAWPKFTHTLIRKGKARIVVISVLMYAGVIVGKLTGEFVALIQRNPS
jgi:thioesterase domain-containing protein